MFELNDIYEVLKKNKITYNQMKHKILKTNEDINKVKETLNGLFVKVVFVRSNLNRYYMICYDSDKEIELTKIAHYIGLNRFTIASEEEVYTILRTQIKRLSPLSVINDIYRKVTVLIDRDLVKKTLLIHPNMYTRTISIYYYDMIRIMDLYYAKYIAMDM